MGIFIHNALVWAAFNNFGIKICLKLLVSKYSCRCHIYFSTFFPLNMSYLSAKNTSPAKLGTATEVTLQVASQRHKLFL